VSERQKSQRGFVAVTLITLLAIAAVIVVYATILGTFKGGTVGVVGLEAKIWYSEDNSTGWTNALSGVSNGSQWYSRLNITSGSYTGLVNVTWTLRHSSNNSVVSGSPTVTTLNFNINSVGDTIYAATDGTAQTENTNWGLYTTKPGNYYVQAVMED